MLLKWWFRFCNNGEALWKKVLSSVHNLPNKVLNLSDLDNVTHGPLKEISVAAAQIPWFETVVNDAMHMKLGNGTKLKLWHYP